MKKIKIVTDSNSGITQREAEDLGIAVLPMPFLIDGEQYYEDINLSQEEFYGRLQSEASVSTSQPAALDVTDLWDKLLKEYDEIVHIPMSSGLSESCHTAMGLAKEAPYAGRVFVVDNQRISVTQKQSVCDALALAERGLGGQEIAEELVRTKFDSSIYISLDTLKYLKKGGRLTPAAALIGTILKIKPVLQIQGEKLDAFRKVNTLKKAKEVMIAAVKNDFETRFRELAERGEMMLAIAYTACRNEAELFAGEIREALPGAPLRFIDPLSLSVSCHIGPGALALACARILR